MGAAFTLSNLSLHLFICRLYWRSSRVELFPSHSGFWSVASLEVYCYWPLSFSFCGRYFHVMLHSHFSRNISECNTEHNISSAFDSLGSSHANTEQRMKTMKTEPNFPWQLLARMTRWRSPPLIRNIHSPGTGLETQMQQRPLGPKRASQGSNRNALPTISRVGSNYVNILLILRKKVY